MSDSDDTGKSLWKKIKQFVGVCLLVFFIIIHVWFKELPMWLLAAPFVLMDIDPRNWFGKSK